MWVAIAAATLGACSPRRDCNAPSAYPSLTLERNNTLTYIASANFAASSRSSIEEGVALATHFLGTSSNTRVYLYEPNGPDSAYTAVTLTLTLTLTLSTTLTLALLVPNPDPNPNPIPNTDPDPNQVTANLCDFWSRTDPCGKQGLNARPGQRGPSGGLAEAGRSSG